MYNLNVEKLEKLRIKKFLSIEKLCLMIEIHPSTYLKLKPRGGCSAIVAGKLVKFFGEEILLDNKD